MPSFRGQANANHRPLAQRSGTTGGRWTNRRSTLSLSLSMKRSPSPLQQHANVPWNVTRGPIPFHPPSRPSFPRPLTRLETEAVGKESGRVDVGKLQNAVSPIHRSRISNPTVSHFACNDRVRTTRRTGRVRTPCAIDRRPGSSMWVISTVAEIGPITPLSNAAITQRRVKERKKKRKKWKKKA